MGHCRPLLAIVFSLLSLWTPDLLGQSAACQEKFPISVRRYNVDSLLQTFGINAEMRTLLDEGSALYGKIGLKEVEISRDAFEIAYLTRRLIELHRIQEDKYFQASLVKKHILVVVDYTKPACTKRLAVVDLNTKRLLYNTLVSHGLGEVKTYSEFPWTIPLNFSNWNGSNLSSLGFIVTLGPKPICNDCHICRFYQDSIGHVCQIELSGLELDINEQIRDRNIIVHTTGSKNWADPTLPKKPKFNHLAYHIVKSGKISICHLAVQDSGSNDYAAAEYINYNKYIGRSDGCLVLPEEEHIGVIRDIMDGSLIFNFSDVISKTSDYFENSPFIGELRRLSTGVRTPVFATIYSRTPNSWNPDWNGYVYEEVMRHRSIFIHNDFLPKDEIDSLWPGFFEASDKQKGAFWVMVVAALARLNSSFSPNAIGHITSRKKLLLEGLLQLSYPDSLTYHKWDITLSRKKSNILDPKINLQSGVIILASQLVNRKTLFDVPNGYWPLLKDKKGRIYYIFPG